jgi:putative flippase GtrA
VSGIRELYYRFRQLIHEGTKFLVVGAVGTVVTFGVANALTGVGKYKAVTVATVVATVVTYLGNRYWSFRHRQSQGTARDSIMFFVMNGIGLLIYYGCIALIQDVAGLSGKLWYNVALVVGTGLGTLFRFWSYRKWVWTAPPAASVLPPVPDLQEHESLTPVPTANGLTDADNQYLAHGQRYAPPTSYGAGQNGHAPARGGRHAGAHRRH